MGLLIPPGRAPLHMRREGCRFQKMGEEQITPFPLAAALESQPVRTPRDHRDRVLCSNTLVQMGKLRWAQSYDTCPQSLGWPVAEPELEAAPWFLLFAHMLVHVRTQQQVVEHGPPRTDRLLDSSPSLASG